MCPPLRWVWGPLQNHGDHQVAHDSALVEEDKSVAWGWQRASRDPLPPDCLWNRYVKVLPDIAPFERTRKVTGYKLLLPDSACGAYGCVFIRCFNKI